MQRFVQALERLQLEVDKKSDLATQTALQSRRAKRYEHIKELQDVRERFSEEQVRPCYITLVKLL